MDLIALEISLDSGLELELLEIHPRDNRYSTLISTEIGTGLT